MKVLVLSCIIKMYGMGTRVSGKSRAGLWEIGRHAVRKLRSTFIMRVLTEDYNRSSIAGHCKRLKIVS